MSAARNQKDVFQMFYGEIPEKINKSLPRPLNRLLKLRMSFTYQQTIIINGFMFGKWLYRKQTPTIKIFLRLQEQQKKALQI